MAKHQLFNNDHPIALVEQDELGFRVYADTLYEMITCDALETPITIGVYGSWGSGKTSILRMLKSRLDSHVSAENSDTSQMSQTITLWFNAWKYDKETIIWRALLFQMIEAIRARNIKSNDPTHDEEIKKALDDLQARLFQAVEREELGNVQVDFEKLAKAALTTGTQVALALTPLNLLSSVIVNIGSEAGERGPKDIFDAFRRERKQIRLSQIKDQDEFQQCFNEALEKYLPPTTRLVIFIDDLDRCAPQKAIEVLEALKLFFDSEKCVFIIGADPRVLLKGVQAKWGTNADERDCWQYLEKIIQLEFRIPKLELEAVQKYVHALIPKDYVEDHRCRQVFSVGALEPNPRQIKRTINTFLLLLTLGRSRLDLSEWDINPVRLAKIVVLQHRYPELYAYIRAYPEQLIRLSRWFMNAGSSSSDDPLDKDPSLGEFAEDPMLREILNQLPETRFDMMDIGTPKPREARREDIIPYFTLARETSDWFFGG